jgi:hypothetical protein
MSSKHITGVPMWLMTVLLPSRAPIKALGAAEQGITAMS